LSPSETVATLQGGGTACISTEGSSSSSCRLSPESLRFPGEDGGRSLNELAVKDLEATLQLLAERAQYITGASGAAIALREGEEMVCRASSGPSAPALGTRAKISSGLCGESVRTQQILCCNDVTSDARVDQESCKAIGIAAVLVMPLLRQGRVIGVFELLSGRAQAFEERDILALERLGHMIQTAIDHAEAASKAPAGSATAVAANTQGLSAAPQARQGTFAGTPKEPESGQRKIRHCNVCGFPVSDGQTLCLDCRNSQGPGKLVAGPVVEKRPALTISSEPQLEMRGGPEEWWQSHKYLIGTVLAAAIMVTAVIFLR